MRRSLNNRPLRSVLANRKMFQGGGIVANGGGARPMANMQPNGILASSPNLINSVVGDAVNPQGGNTLSMADGGIARFREGGVNDLRRRVQYALSIKPDEIYETQGGNYTPDEEVLTLLEGLNPNNPIYADVANAAEQRGLSIPNIQMAEGPSAISSDQPAQPTERPKFLSELLLEEEQVPMPTPESAQIAPADAPATFPTEEGVGIIPPSEITGEDVLAFGSYIGLDGTHVFPQKAADVPTGKMIYDFDTDQFKEVSWSGDKDVETEGVAGYGPRGGSSDDMTKVGKAINRAFDATADAKDVADQEPGIEYAPRGGSETAMEKVAKDFAAAEAITPRAPRKKSAIEAKHQDPDDFDIDAASAEFLSRMPAYEGDTSGMNLIVLGAAIMEGESEHWAVNVGKGLTKAMPLFIKDKKDREAFDRSVQMAATKYGLSKRDTIETERRALERTKNNFYLDNDIVFKDDEGNVVEKFTQGYTRLNDRQIAAIQAQEGITLMPMDVVLHQMKGASAREIARVQGIEPVELFRDTPDTIKFNLGREEFNLDVYYPKPNAKIRYPQLMPMLLNEQTLISGYNDGAEILETYGTLAGSARDILDKQGSVSGAGGWIGKITDFLSALDIVGDDGSASFKGFNVKPSSDAKTTNNLLTGEAQAWASDPDNAARLKAAGFTVDSFGFDKPLEGTKHIALTGAGVSDVNSYNTVLRFLSIKMAPLLLGESGKTISDGDRRLIASALGMAEGSGGNWEFVSAGFTSEAQLRQRLSLIQFTIDNARKNLDRQYQDVWNQFIPREEQLRIMEETRGVDRKPPSRSLVSQDGVWTAGA